MLMEAIAKTADEVEAEVARHVTLTGRQPQRPYIPFQVGPRKSRTTLYALAHPLTCGGNRGDEAHREYAATVGRDEGELEYFADGSLRCPVCDYVQRLPAGTAWADPATVAAA